MSPIVVGRRSSPGWVHPAGGRSAPPSLVAACVEVLFIIILEVSFASIVDEFLILITVSQPIFRGNPTGWFRRCRRPGRRRPVETAGQFGATDATRGNNRPGKA